MKVTTIDGGFRGRPRARGARGARGLGDSSGFLSTQESVAEGDRFDGTLVRYFAARAALAAAIRQGDLPEAVARETQAAMDVLDGRYAQLDAQLTSLRPEWLGGWRNEAAAFAVTANRFADTLEAALQSEGSSRPWKVAGLFLVCTAVLAVGAWWLGARGR